MSALTILKIAAAPKRVTRSVRYIPVVVIDRNVVFRAGLASIITGSQFRVTGTFASVDELPEKGAAANPWLALINAESGRDDVQLSIEHLVSRGVLVIVLGESCCPEEVGAALEAGASGYLPKGEITPAVLLKSLELVRLGLAVIPYGQRKSAAPVPDRQQHLARDAVELDLVSQLSSGEVAILRLLTEGASNKEIARRFNVAESTVKVRLMFLLRKLRVSNRTQAAMWATQHLRVAMIPLLATILA